MQILYRDKFIDTKQAPLHNDEELIACCKLCEAYCGEEHDFQECSNCPTLDLYKEWAKLHYQNWFDSWESGTYQNGW